MLTYLQLFFEFFKTGLFAVGGGLATLPFLHEISDKTGWFTTQDISNMIAVSESTPGAIGINMSTYVGFITGGVLGGVLATFALVLPSIIIIELISKIMDKFKNSSLVKDIFYSLRPAATAMIAAAGISVAGTTFIKQTDSSILFEWKAFILGALLFAGIKLFKGHPVIYIAIAAIVGIIFGF